MERVFSLSQVHFNIFELSCKKLLTNNYNGLTICLQDVQTSRRNKVRTRITPKQRQSYIKILCDNGYDFIRESSDYYASTYFKKTEVRAIKVILGTLDRTVEIIVNDKETNKLDKFTSYNGVIAYIDEFKSLITSL